MNLSPLVRQLKAEGHQVFAALRDLSKAPMLAGAGVSYLQSPYKADSAANPIPAARTFAHILHNVGFADAAELAVMVDAWVNLIDAIRPDMIVFDHSPTALLAARGCKTRRVVLGNSFSSPPDCSPWPDIRPWLPGEPQSLFQTEETVLENANRVLCNRGQQPLERLGQLYGEVDAVILTTLAEFDHYPSRSSQRYRGPWPPDGGEAPQWPLSRGKRVFAYLKPFPVLPKLLAMLGEMDCSTVVHIDGKASEFARYASPSLRFQHSRLDLQRAAEECDLAILNGTHGSTVLTLLAGKPVLQLPLVLEQELNSRTTARLGAGEMIIPWHGQGLETALTRLLQSAAYREAARRFATRYAEHSPDQECQRAVNDLLGLLG